MAARRPLIRLSKDVYLIKAPTLEAGSTAAARDAPRCIVLFGWMDGEPVRSSWPSPETDLSALHCSSNEAHSEIRRLLSYTGELFVAALIPRR